MGNIVFNQLRKYHLPLRSYASAPSLAIIEITNRCNLECKMCYHSHLNNAGDISLLNFQLIMNEIPVGTRICLGGCGEPFLHTDLIKMFKYCNDKGFSYISSMTNGTLIEPLINDLAQLKISELVFSIDASDKETYERIRVGSNFEQVISNLKLVTEKTNIPVAINTVIMKDNFDSINSIPELAASINKNIRLHFQTALEYTDYVENQDPVSLYILIRELEDKCKSLGLRYGFTDLTSKINCSQIFTDMYIGFKGFLAPCCLLPDKGLVNVTEIGVKKSWNGREIRAWREAILNGDYPKECIKICNIGKNKKG